MPSLESRTTFGPETPDPLIALGRPIAEAPANEFYNLLYTVTAGRYTITPKLDPGTTYVSGPELAATHSDQQNAVMSEAQLIGQASFLLDLLTTEDPQTLGTLSEPVRATDGRTIELRAGDTPDSPVRVRLGINDILIRDGDGNTRPHLTSEKRALRTALKLDTDYMSQSTHPRFWVPMGWIVPNPGEAMPLRQIQTRLRKQLRHVITLDPAAPLRR